MYTATGDFIEHFNLNSNQGRNYTHIDNAWIDRCRDRTNSSEKNCEKRCTDDEKM